MAHRILHCGKSLTNYYLCLEKGVAGFTGAKATAGDCIYLAVRVERGTICGGRAVLAEPTQENLWSTQYPVRFKLSTIEFCTPFDLSNLKSVGGSQGPIKYVQGSKPIKDQDAQKFLEDTFNANKTDKLVRLGQ